MKEFAYESYDDLPLFLDAAAVAKMLGISPSSGCKLMHVVTIYVSLSSPQAARLTHFASPCMTPLRIFLPCSTRCSAVTRDGRRRNSTLRRYIRSILEAVDHYRERQLRRLELDTERQRTWARLSRLCTAQGPLPTAGRPTPPAAERSVSGPCGPECRMDGLGDFQNSQVNRETKNVQEKERPKTSPT